MADGARPDQKRAAQEVSPEAQKILDGLPARVNKEPGYSRKVKRRHEWTPLQETAAKLYGQGFSRNQIAKALLDHLCRPRKNQRTGYELSPTDRLKRARQKLRQWEAEEWFRDRIYATAMIAVDLATPQIMTGVVNKAKRGRVDAAKFALEQAGRYTPKTTDNGGNITVVIGEGLPRPLRNTEPIDVEVEEAEWEDV